MTANNKNKIAALTLILFSLCTNINAQKIIISNRIILNDKLKENSGLIFINEDVWTHNDSGNKNKIYKISSKTGEIKESITISNAVNSDWEDICKSDKYIFVGDIGNNKGQRELFQIYRVKIKDLYSDKENVIADRIEFYYDSTYYVPGYQKKTNFDCEAMIYYKDSLYIFTKNWENKKTYLNTIPASPGKYKAHFIDSLNVEALITGADICDSTGTIALVGYKYGMPENSIIILLSNYKNNNFFTGIIEYYTLKLKAYQTEGICFYDNNTLILSNEQFVNKKQSFFYLNIENTLTNKNISNPIYKIDNDKLILNIEKIKKSNIKLFENKYKLIDFDNKIETDKNKITINLSGIDKSIPYIVKISKKSMILWLNLTNNLDFH